MDLLLHNILTDDHSICSLKQISSVVAAHH